VRAAAAFLAALALAAVACGGEEGAEEVLAETATGLAEIRSGTMSFEYAASGEGGPEAGVKVEGPFSLAGDHPLPVAELKITQFAGSRSASTTFISTGEKAFVRVGSETFELPPEEFGGAEGESGGGQAGLGELRIEDWFLDPTLSNGGEVGGADTDRIRSPLDVVAALNDFIEAAGALGGADLSPIEGPSAQNLENAVQSATVDVYTGKDDRLLRRVAIEVDLELVGSNELREALGQLAGAHLRLDLRITDPNEPVSVEEPEGAVPYPGD
jgi:hypothetical protein